jgi:hypothetical protein
MRFSLRRLMLAVLAVALGLAAIMANAIWVAYVVTMVFFLALGLAAVGSLVGQGCLRVFCAGFAVFGIMYAALLWDETSSRAAASISQSPTAAMLHWLAEFRQPRPFLGESVSARWPNNGSYYPATVIDYDPDRDIYLTQWTDGSTPSWLSRGQMQPVGQAMLRTGHAVFAVLLGVFGGSAACLCFGSTDRHSHGIGE